MSSSGVAAATLWCALCGFERQATRVVDDEFLWPLPEKLLIIKPVIPRSEPFSASTN